ncbi:hypothetical protein [Nocardioides sp. AE5]|uniref:hypothetical protein n=1 Tax=Nocardioides sp. AE5 TaxID=2962573 RepID=UPI00288200D5|nr:hypothetical protein [Nocardioides sp. AE5]MDT0203431.1 hypothetical protein [Nocardioides sp. AE5]
MSHVSLPLRRLLGLAAALVLGLTLTACGGDDPAPEPGPPSVGAEPRTELMDQWRYAAVLTPDGDEVDLAPTNAWLVLNAGGNAQGQDGRPWQATYQSDEESITFEVTNRATVPLDASEPEAAALAAEVTTELLAGGPVDLEMVDEDTLELSVDEWVLTLERWR